MGVEPFDTTAATAAAIIFLLYRAFCQDLHINTEVAGFVVGGNVLQIV